MVIYNRTFATGNQRYLNITNDDYLRPMSIGANWSRIRIGVLMAMGTVSGNAWPIRTASLSMGVCNGILNSPSVYSPTHVFGWALSSHINSPSAGNFTYNAGTSGNSYFSNSGWTVFRTIGLTTATGTTGSFTLNIPSNAPGGTARRGVWILDINKSALVSGNITQGLTGGATAHMSLDLTSSDLYTALESYSTAATIQGTQLSTLGLGNSLAFNETTNGALDTIFFAWNHYTVPVELYELAVYRVG